MMPSKKKKYNARFPAGRIKKIMQTDEDVGKVAQAVPVIISRALELFVESLLRKAVEITNGRNAKTLTPSHMKQCILSESRFDFLKDLVTNIPDVSATEEEIAPSNASSTQVVPNYYQSVKKERERAPRGRGRGRGAPRTCFTGRSSSTSSQAGTAAWTRNLTPPSTPLASVPPSFYRETLTDSSQSNPDSKWGEVMRPPVIQHTGPSHQKPNPDESEDEEDEEESNGYGLICHTKPLLIDEDYDT